jgi:hypothetical protein
VGEAARRDIVHECRLGSTVGESRTVVAQSGRPYCVVLNDHDILMGHLRRKQLQSGDEGVVENAMEPVPRQCARPNLSLRYSNIWKRVTFAQFLSPRRRGGLSA